MTIGYWKKRSHLRYYDRVKELLEELSPSSSDSSILDVGCADTPIATWGTFARRRTIDLRHDPELEGVTSIVGDFATLPEEDVAGPHDVVTCLQVLEHLTDEELEPFVRRLYQVSRYLIVSVPFEWPKGAAPSHLQDPIDMGKFFRMVHAQFTTSTPFPRCWFIVDNGLVRLVALLRGDVT